MDRIRITLTHDQMAWAAERGFGVSIRHTPARPGGPAWQRRLERWTVLVQRTPEFAPGELALVRACRGSFATRCSGTGETLPQAWAAMVEDVEPTEPR